MRAHRRRGRPFWINADFGRLWLGESVSLVGSRVSDLAVPLTGLLVLDAGPAQLGILSALQYAPIVLVTLPAGMLVDRCSARGSRPRACPSPSTSCWRTCTTP